MNMATQSKQTLSANGDTAVIDWAGGEGLYSARGTWGSGTTTLMASFDDGSNYTSAGTEGVLTADGMVLFTLPACKLKISLTGATSPSLDVTIESLK